MTAASPLISVIIPTRERADTLAATVDSALDSKSARVEVIVSDNESQDETAAVVKEVADPRLRHVRTGRRMSMCDNYEFGLEHARGDYVIIIGDDDAIVPGGLDYLIRRIDTQADKLVYMWPLHVYDWPAEGRPAHLDYLAPEMSEWRVDLKVKARQVVTHGGWKYYELPSAYHCAVPRRIFDAIRQRTGRVFHSTQPDVFTAMAIPAFADWAINLGRGVSMNGRSARSNGLGFISAAARPNIDRFIAEYGDYRFHSTLSPVIAPRGNMIPDAILIAKELFPDIYGDTDFGYDAMLAYISRLRFASLPQIFRERAAIARSHPLSLVGLAGRSLVHETAALRRRFLNKSHRTPLHKDVPADIYRFAQLLASARPFPES